MKNNITEREDLKKYFNYLRNIIDSYVLSPDIHPFFVDEKEIKETFKNIEKILDK